MTMRLSRCAGFTLFIIIALNGMLSADEAAIGRHRSLLETSGFPENDETRRLFSDAIAAPSYAALETPFRISRQISDNRLVQFEARKAATDWYLIFRNQRGVEPRESYPLWGRGTWIIKKDLLTGTFLQAKIFLQDDEFSFVRIFPANDGRSRLDVHLYGRQLGDDVIIPVPFEELMLAPFARIAALTDRSIEWEMLFPNPDSTGYRRIENFVAQLDLVEESIVEVTDAAVDGGGRNVYIEGGGQIGPGVPTRNGGVLEAGQTGLNCSGYVKWVADGVYSAWTGRPGSRFLDLNGLNEPTGRTGRNPWSQSRSATGGDARADLESILRDPWFGLDWNRNLAYMVEEARLGRPLSQNERRVLDTGELAGLSHVADLGYPLDELAAALYQLAARRPGAVYLAAVNSRYRPAPTPDDPDPLPLHQYWHVSIFAPWFSAGPPADPGVERGSFHVAVLDVGDVSESLLVDPGIGGESRYISMIRANAVRYAGFGTDDSGRPVQPEVMVHLVRMDIPRDFVPSPLPEAR